MMSTILFTINDETFEATLTENETTQALIEQLPLEITMNDLNANEKYFDLDQSLPTQSEQVNFIENGDFMLYGGRTIVLFYKDFETPYSYTRLGKVSQPENLASVLGKGNVDVRIEWKDEQV